MNKSWTAASLMAASLLLPGAAHAQYKFKWPVTARTSGVLCKGVDWETERHLIRDSRGVSTSGRRSTLICPIVRRNTAPYGTQDFRSGSKVNLESVDIWVFSPPPEGKPEQIECRVFSYSLWHGETWSPPQRLGPASKNRLTFTRPLGDPPEFDDVVTVGFECELPEWASILGSVATFQKH
jgi:hypothetical protein